MGEKIGNYFPIFTRSYWLSLGSGTGFFRSVPWVITLSGLFEVCTLMPWVQAVPEDVEILGEPPGCGWDQLLWQRGFLNDWGQQRASQLRCLALHTSAFACGIVMSMPEILLPWEVAASDILAWLSSLACTSCLKVFGIHSVQGVLLNLLGWLALFCDISFSPSPKIGLNV